MKDRLTQPRARLIRGQSAVQPFLWTPGVDPYATAHPQEARCVTDPIHEIPAQRSAVDEDRLLTLPEGAQVLGVSVRTLQRMRAAGEIGFVTVGTGSRRPRIRFTRQHLRDFVLRAEHLACSLPASRCT
jgi:excisionase family DNA binding protein